MAETVTIRPGERLVLVITTNNEPSRDNGPDLVSVHVDVERDPHAVVVPQPGRKGYSPDYFAWLVEQFHQAERDDPRAPVGLLARRLNRAPATVGRQLTRARKMGLLTDPSP
jgi:hypothetical protein